MMGKLPAKELEWNPFSIGLRIESIDYKYPLSVKRPGRYVVRGTPPLFEGTVPYDLLDRIFAIITMCPGSVFRIPVTNWPVFRSYILDHSPSYAASINQDIGDFEDYFFSVSYRFNRRLKAAHWDFFTTRDDFVAMAYQLTYHGSRFPPGVYFSQEFEATAQLPIDWPSICKLSEEDSFRSDEFQLSTSTPNFRRIG